MAGARGVGKLLSKNAAVFLCDMQEKFRPMIQYFPDIVTNCSRIVQAAKLLELPIICTEQYPKGLGRTVEELKINELGIKPIEKTQFSMLVDEVDNILKKHPEQVKSIILCGIEAHVCIQHTTLDLIERGYDVHVVVDACSSRSMVDRMYAYDRLKEIGAFLTTSESVILGLAGGSHHPKFRDLQKIIMESAPDTGLLNSHI